MAPKGVSNRTLIAKKKGIKMGSYILCLYREEGKGAQIKFEGLMADRRIGGTDRESYIELKKCIRLGEKGEIIGIETSGKETRRLVDAWIDDMDLAKPRSQEEIDAAAQAAALAIAGSGGTNAGSSNGAGSPNGGCGACGGFGCGGCGGCCGCGGCGGCGGCCGGCGCGGFGGCGCGGCGMGMPMMNPMMSGMGMMNPMMGMMNPMMGMMGMNPMMGMMGAMGGMGMAGMPQGMMPTSVEEDDSDEAPEENSSAAVPPVPDHLLLPGLKSEVLESQDVELELESIDEGAYIKAEYSHPTLGKTTYEGTLQEKFKGASAHQSYVQLTSCKRFGSKGKLMEEEASKKLMTAFIDAVSVTAPGQRASKSRSRSRSRDKTKASSGADS